MTFLWLCALLALLVGTALVSPSALASVLLIWFGAYLVSRLT
jgi:hypothetical protein